MIALIYSMLTVSDLNSWFLQDSKYIQVCLFIAFWSIRYLHGDQVNLLFRRKDLQKTSWWYTTYLWIFGATVQKWVFKFSLITEPTNFNLCFKKMGLILSKIKTILKIWIFVVTIYYDWYFLYIFEYLCVGELKIVILYHKTKNRSIVCSFKVHTIFYVQLLNFSKCLRTFIFIQMLLADIITD